MTYYLIRLDDACPTMHLKNWKKIEILLDKYKILPLVAVIPNNKDRSLFFSKKDPLFWQKIRKWKKKNWSIAIHGFNHQNNSKSAGILKINTKSEFSGIKYCLQKKKITKSFQIMKNKKIKTNYWVAPFHSFDENTIKIFANNFKNVIISDGFSFRANIYKKLTWIPQQLWKFYPMPFGTWTVCLHPNTMTSKDFKKLEKSFLYYRNKIISFDIATLNIKNKNILDFFFEIFFIKIFQLKKFFKI